VGAQRILVEIDLNLARRPTVGNGIWAPATVVNCGRMKFWARSKSSTWESVSLDNANWIIGTLEAL
jgi:hypothetical protein